MRIASWNINGLRARQDFVLHWLRARQPDVVALQELKLTDEQFPHEVFAAAGYDAVVFGQKAWNGVAVVARRPLRLEEVARGLPDHDEDGARLISAHVAAPSAAWTALELASVYVPNGKDVGHDDFQGKLSWLDSLARWLEPRAAPGAPLVVGGDFNLCPAPLDSWNEAQLEGMIFHTDEERERFRRFEAMGLYDLYRTHHPTTQAFSWWDYRAGAFHKGKGLRIDFLLGTAAVRDQVIDAAIDRDYRKKKDGLTASDHAPVIVDVASPLVV